ncbi:WXG100 family type VII secretion target [Rhodococcus sp. D2-41]|nr:WXG100 family type VII secretion target [Rhodococcus sp. D2-41]
MDKARLIGQRIEDSVAEVEREVAGLHVRWDGEGAEAHQEKHDIWCREIREMQAALSGLEFAVRLARERYIATVQHNMRMWP